MQKVIQVQCLICNGTGFIKREVIICKDCNESICVCHTPETIKLPPYIECKDCDGNGYHVKSN